MPEVDYELYKLITVSGADAAEFLQGQLTQDVTLLATKQSMAAACCNPQGRVISTLRLISLDGAIGMVLPAEMAEPVVALFSKYRMRSAVQFDLSGDEWEGVAIDQDADAELLQSSGLLPEASGTLVKNGIFAIRHASGDQFVELFGAKIDLQSFHPEFDAPLGTWIGWAQSVSTKVVIPGRKSSPEPNTWEAASGD